MNSLTVTFRLRWFHKVFPGRTPTTALARFGNLFGVECRARFESVQSYGSKILVSGFSSVRRLILFGFELALDFRFSLIPNSVRGSV